MYLLEYLKTLPLCSLSVIQVKGESMSGNDRILASLYALGLPIAEGALSTIFGFSGRPSHLLKHIFQAFKGLLWP